MATRKATATERFFAKELGNLYLAMDKIKERETIWTQFVAGKKELLEYLEKHKPTDQLNTMMGCFQYLADLRVNAKLTFDRQSSGFDQSVREVLNDDGVHSMIKDLGELAKAVQVCKEKGHELNMEPVPFLQGLENHKEGPFHERTEELAWSKNLEAKHHRYPVRVDYTPDITTISREGELFKTLKARVIEEHSRIRAIPGINLERAIDKEREKIKTQMKDAMLRLQYLEDAIKANRGEVNDYDKLERMAKKVYLSANSTAKRVLQANNLGNALKIALEVVEDLIMASRNATSAAQSDSERGKSSREFVDDDSDSDTLFVRE
ncbi:hypothetical protein IQ07DRAFT_660449 [Pyrenochaeta sp. DS3sAY3a]|nr:hypothetical protein IQ07DRAFT_660449 [Pyrenochaeta sp. DS3sAY3a]